MRFSMTGRFHIFATWTGRREFVSIWIPDPDEPGAQLAFRDSLPIFRHRANFLLPGRRTRSRATGGFVQPVRHAAPHPSASDRNEFLRQTRSRPRYWDGLVGARQRTTAWLSDFSQICAVYRF